MLAITVVQVSTLKSKSHDVTLQITFIILNKWISAIVNTLLYLPPSVVDITLLSLSTVTLYALHLLLGLHQTWQDASVCCLVVHVIILFQFQGWYLVDLHVPTFWQYKACPHFISKTPCWIFTKVVEIHQYCYTYSNHVLVWYIFVPVRWFLADLQPFDHFQWYSTKLGSHAFL